MSGRKLLLALLLGLAAHTPPASAQLVATVNGARPIQVMAGDTFDFFIDVYRAPSEPSTRFTGMFSDPTATMRPSFRFRFRQPPEGRCNAYFGADLLPGPNFAGWFGAEGLAPGETLRCRVTLTVPWHEREGIHVVAFGQQNFLVQVAVPPPRLVPALGWGAGIILFVLVGIAAARSKRTHVDG